MVDDDAVPSSYAECNHGPGGEGAAAAGAAGAKAAIFPVATHWLTDEHSYDEPGDIYVCVVAGQSGVAAIGTFRGDVEIVPRRQRVHANGTGVVRFRVWATQDSGDTSLFVGFAFDSGMGEGSVFGPEITLGEDTWSFRENE